MDLFCLPWLSNISHLILVYHSEILRIVWLCDLLCCQVVRTSDLLVLTTIEESLVYSELGIPPLNYLSHTLVFDIFEFKVPLLPIVTQEDYSECGYAHQPLGKLIVSTVRFQSISLTDLSVICGVTHFWWRFPRSASLVLLVTSCHFGCSVTLPWSGLPFLQWRFAIALCFVTGTTSRLWSWCVLWENKHLYIIVWCCLFVICFITIFL